MKRFWLLVLCVLMLLILCACPLTDTISDSISTLTGSDDSTGYEYEEEAEQFSSDTTYMNEYLGITFTVPSGWWLYDLNADNLSETGGLTKNASSLDIYKEDGYAYIWMLSAANLQYSSKDNHIGLDIMADRDDAFGTFEDYLADYDKLMLEPNDDGTVYTLEETGTVDINGVTFTKRIYTVPAEAPYYLMDLICPVGDGYIMIITANFWLKNTDAEDYIIQLLEKNLTLA